MKRRLFSISNDLMSFYMFLEDSNSFHKKVIKLPKNIIIRLQYCKHKQEKNSKRENLKPSITFKVDKNTEKGEMKVDKKYERF